MRASDYGQALTDLKGFLRLYAEYVELHDVRRGFDRYWVPKPGAEERIKQLRSRVSGAAGRAMAAFVLAETLVAYKAPFATHATRHNPAQVWATFTDEYPIIDPDSMAVVGGQAVGRLESLYQQAKARERGLAGFLARFVRFPVSVREAAGLPPKTVKGGLLTGAVAVAQTLVTGTIVGAVGGALAIPLAKHFGWA